MFRVLAPLEKADALVILLSAAAFAGQRNHTVWFDEIRLTALGEHKVVEFSAPKTAFVTQDGRYGIHALFTFLGNSHPKRCR